MWERNPAIAAAVADLFAAGFIVLDFETTASSSDPDVAIVEIGLLSYTGEVLLDTAVKPRRRITAQATAVHGLDNRDVAGAPAFAKVYPRLAEWLNGREVVAYNAEADEKALAITCRRFKLPSLTPHQWHDAMRLYMAYCRSPRFIRLTVACEHEGIPVTHVHRAIDDCRLTLQLLRRIADR
jgi:DNA polymerase-3 subunit epsilon